MLRSSAAPMRTGMADVIRCSPCVARSCFSLAACPRAAEECLDCHELAAISPGGTVVHPPFGEKDCGSCHADHGDQERLMLTEEGNALCAQCHEFADAAFLARAPQDRADRQGALHRLPRPAPLAEQAPAAQRAARAR